MAQQQSNDAPSPLFTEKNEGRTLKFPFRMSPEERQLVGEAAEKLGVSPTTLIRMYIRKGLGLAG